MSRCILSKLHTRRFGRSLLIVDQCLSTNTLAAQLADTGAPEGLTVLAKKQHHGRGRHGRAWQSPEGGLWLSIVLRPLRTFSPLQCLPAIGAVSIALAANAIHRTKASVRWPNDVILNGRKFAGTLAELKSAGQEPQHVILGMGINTNFPASALIDVIPPPTTLSDALGHEIDENEILGNVLYNLEQMYQQLSAGNHSGILKLLIETDSTAGRRLRINLEHESLTGMFERYLTLSRVRILDDQNNQRDIDTNAVVSVEFPPDGNR